MMKKFLILMALLFFTSTASAEIKIYTGVGEYYLDPSMTMDYAKQKAKIDAERNAQEQAYVYVRNHSTTKNAMLSEDEIETITVGIIKVMDVKYYIMAAEDNIFLIRAIVKAEIDTDEIPKWIEKIEQEG